MRSRKHAKPIADQVTLAGPHRARAESDAGPAEEGGPVKTYPKHFRYPASARRQAPIRYAR